MAIVLTRNLQSVFLKQFNNKWDQSTAETENMIGIQDLKMLGSDSYLINISRGNINVFVDEIQVDFINKVSIEPEDVWEL